MITATRRVLDACRDRGGDVTEHVWDGVGHAPHRERVEAFAEIIDELRGSVAQQASADVTRARADRRGG